MHVSLTAELDSRVKAKVESGLYNNASEVTQEALRFIDAHEEWVQEVKNSLLRKQIRVGVDQLESGEGSMIDSKEALNSLINKLIPQIKS